MQGILPPALTSEKLWDRVRLLVGAAVRRREAEAAPGPRLRCRPAGRRDLKQLRPGAQRPLAVSGRLAGKREGAREPEMGPNSGGKVLRAKWGHEKDQVRIVSRCCSFPLFSPLALFLCESSQAFRSFNPHLSNNDYV